VVEWSAVSNSLNAPYPFAWEFWKSRHLRHMARGAAIPKFPRKGILISPDFSRPQNLTSIERPTNTERDSLHYLQSQAENGLFAFLIGEGQMTVSKTPQAARRWDGPSSFDLPPFKLFFVGIVLQPTSPPRTLTNRAPLEEQLASSDRHEFRTRGHFSMPEKLKLW
jgi:hypothetical protein